MLPSTATVIYPQLLHHVLDTTWGHDSGLPECGARQVLDALIVKRRRRDTSKRRRKRPVCSGYRGRPAAADAHSFVADVGDIGPICMVSKLPAPRLRADPMTGMPCGPNPTLFQPCHVAFFQSGRLRKQEDRKPMEELVGVAGFEPTTLSPPD